jgi:Flp pilus assembly protein TadD
MPGCWKTSYIFGALFGLIGIAFGWVIWGCESSRAINFLPQDYRANWIICPIAVRAGANPAVELDTIFRREIEIKSLPRAATVIARAAKQFELRINGAPVPFVRNSSWKRFVTVDVAQFLQVGANTIEARVYNSTGPPALWFRLYASEVLLQTDETWQASYAGGAWRQSVIASEPRFPGPGNSVGGAETVASLSNVWRSELAFAAIAIIASIIFYFLPTRFRDRLEVLARSILILIVPTIVWIVLFWHNVVQMPFALGFDANYHLDYIKYIQQRIALPLPTQGYEMFQPPLFYVLSAFALRICDLSVGTIPATVLLRAMTGIFGIGNFIFVFLTLHLLFPRRTTLPVVGMLLSAFLPMQMYLSHYVTNETLAAMLVSVSIYLTVRLWQAPKALFWRYLSLGACLGAAALAKATVLILIPAFALPIITKLYLDDYAGIERLRNSCSLMGAFCLVCGWHYFRIWSHFGTPLLGNWDPRAGFPLWQYPGYHVASDYFRFGRTFVAPFFSSLNGFGDGIYSTFYGDGLCGGTTDLAFRPPWNYGLMVAGYFLGLLPTLLIAMGVVLALWDFRRAVKMESVMFIGIAAIVMFALVVMSLRVPSYAQIKAFYGLPALTPICFFAVLGWEFITKHIRFVRTLLGPMLLMWAINNVASVWIGNTTDQHANRLRRVSGTSETGTAVVSAAKSDVAKDPKNPVARRMLALALSEGGRLDEARTQAEQAVALDPADANCHVQLGTILLKLNKNEDSLNQGRVAVELGPEDADAYKLLLFALVKEDRNNDLIDVARNALTVTPADAQIHYALAIALAKTDDFVDATAELGYALLLQPNWAEAATKLRLALSFLNTDPDGPRHLDEAVSAMPSSSIGLDAIAWVFATSANSSLRNGQKAIDVASRACKIANYKNPRLLNTLAAAYAEAGRFPEATAITETARRVAESSNDVDAFRFSEKLHELFASHAPYRESSPGG